MKRTIMETMGWKNEAYVKAVLFEAFRNYRKQLKTILKAVDEIQNNIQPILRTIGIDELEKLTGESFWPPEWAALTCNLEYSINQCSDNRELEAVEHLCFLGHSLSALSEKVEKTKRFRWKNKKLLEKERARHNELWSSDDPNVFTKARYTVYDRFEKYMLDMEDEYLRTGVMENGEESREPLL